MMQPFENQQPSLLELIEVEPIHQKQIAGPGIPAAAVHASDQAHLFGAHIHLLLIHQIIAAVANT